MSLYLKISQRISQNWKSCAALIVPLPDQIRPANIFFWISYHLMYLITYQGIHSFWFFFSNVFVTPFINKSKSSRDLTIFITSSIFSFELINILVRPETRICFWIPVPAAYAAAVKTNGKNMFLGSCSDVFIIAPFNLLNKAVRNLFIELLF